MDEKTFNLTAGALLHDIGKVVYRAGTYSRSHSVSGTEFMSGFTGEKDILDCIRYHHGKGLKPAKIDRDSPAYIVYIADNISSGLDRRDKEVEGEARAAWRFDKKIPLSSVFNLLNGNNGSFRFKPGRLERRAGVNYPDGVHEVNIDRDQYNQILQELKDKLSGIKLEPGYLNSILGIYEACLTYIPASTMKRQVSDISLYDHSKTTAAIAACIYSYLCERNKADYKKILFSNSRLFYEEKAFLMLSCDISGIQKFIYAIPDKGAMKSLRARSFYLEMLLEHVMDLLLKEAGLCRANLIYTGGGHAYVLLPNTKETFNIIENTFKTVNRWLSAKFGTALYIAAACRECSANELMNKPADKAPYQKIFIELSHKLSQIKQRRYGPGDIRRLNAAGGPDDRGRECKACGAVESMVSDEDICSMCKSFIVVSNNLIKGEGIILATDAGEDMIPGLPLPGLKGEKFSILAMPQADAEAYLESHRDRTSGIYGRNVIYSGYGHSTKIWMGDYYARSRLKDEGEEAIATFEELADRSKGIKRLGVLRADVDDLGKAFILGFLRTGEQNPVKRTRYLTLSRTASFSRMLSLFFKLNINSILEVGAGEDGQFRLEDDEEPVKREVTIVYSGGDDVFLVGAWNEVVGAAVDIRRAFRKFSGGTLDLSAGIGIYPVKYPIRLMAGETAELEEQAKRNEGKGSIALFGSELNSRTMSIEYRHVYKWEEFEQKVVGEKLRLLQRFCKDSDSKGAALLYRFIMLVRGMEEDRVNLARFAYQLGKLQPDRRDAEEEKLLYDKFSTSMYKWFLDANERRQLLTAMYIMLYQMREKDDLEGDSENG